VGGAAAGHEPAPRGGPGAGGAAVRNPPSRIDWRLRVGRSRMHGAARAEAQPQTGPAHRAYLMTRVARAVGSNIG